MAMFSSELSVYTLAVISVERMVAIIFYFDPDKHLKTRHIAVAMVSNQSDPGIITGYHH